LSDACLRNNFKKKVVRPKEFDEHNNTNIDERMTLVKAKELVEHDKKGIAKRLFSEFLGTLLITFWSTGVVVVDVVTQADIPEKGVSELRAAAAAGIMVTVMTFALGNVSGAHVSNAVTLGFLIRGIFPVRLALGYMLAQIVGGFLAATILWCIFGMVGDVGVSVPLEGHLYQALGLEILISFLEVFTVFTVATREKIIGSNAAIAYGAAVCAGALLSIGVTAGGTNPAETVGPAVVAWIFGRKLKPLKVLWIYIVGPFVGAGLAAGAMAILKRGTTAEDLENAAGEATL
jgi:aquaporin Z